MRCAACGSEIVKRSGEIDLRVHERLYLVRHVCYEECSSCGERVLSPEIAQALFDKIKKGDFIEEAVRIPVLDGTYG